MNRETFFGVFSIITFNDESSIISLRQLGSQTNETFGNYCSDFESERSIEKTNVFSIKYCKPKQIVLLFFDLKCVKKYFLFQAEFYLDDANKKNRSVYLRKLKIFRKKILFSIKHQRIINIFWLVSILGLFEIYVILLSIFKAELISKDRNLEIIQSIFKRK